MLELCVCGVCGAGKEGGRSVEISYVTDSRDTEEKKVIGGANRPAAEWKWEEKLNTELLWHLNMALFCCTNTLVLKSVNQWIESVQFFPLRLLCAQAVQFGEEKVHAATSIAKWAQCSCLQRAPYKANWFLTLFMGVCFIRVLGNWVCMLAPISFSLYLRSNSGRYSSFRPFISQAKGFHKSRAAVCLHKTAHQKSLFSSRGESEACRGLGLHSTRSLFPECTFIFYLGEPKERGF